MARLARIPFYEVLLPFIVFTLSALLTRFLYRNPRVSWLVGKANGRTPDLYRGAIRSAVRPDA